MRNQTHVLTGVTIGEDRSSLVHLPICGYTCSNGMLKYTVQNTLQSLFPNPPNPRVVSQLRRARRSGHYTPMIASSERAANSRKFCG